MRILITEKQYLTYIRRRLDCMRVVMDNIKSGEITLPIPPRSFDWNTYKFIFSAILINHCGGASGEFFEQQKHDEIMEFFGDELYELYKMNK